MNKSFLSFAAAGSIMSIIFLVIVNLLTSPETIWYIYPSLAFILWPIYIYSLQRGKYKSFSLLVSLFLVIYLITQNYISTPSYPWFLYAIYPIIWWPILIFLGKHTKLFKVSLFGSISTIVYYSLLNGILSPEYPWAIYPAFVVLWWPLATYYAKNKRYYEFSISSSLLISTFFITVNIISSPHTIWAVYPIFVVLWWPLSMYFYSYKRKGH
ncbi:hypothetical protein [Bacillus sp. 165]|uniref:hypothetical protein n=1 Tax=Bacillus sp. 165 TaxID=1529117 RepID=UPI001ADC4006|nr:hypothetical protein [Bacillus sp. 165]MBO9130724.1 hypothetical protein [Bacillus sp. 165]